MTEFVSPPPMAMMLRTERWRVLLVGGGAVALRKAKALSYHVAELLVVAPQILPDLQAMAESHSHDDEAQSFRMQLYQREFCDADLDGVDWVVVATGVSPLAHHIHSLLAQRPQVRLSTFADFPELGNAQFPAVWQQPEFTIAVSTHGNAPRVAAQMRNAIQDSLDPEQWKQAIKSDRATEPRPPAH